MKDKSIYWIFWILSWMMTLNPWYTSAQSVQAEFGKNRVQYHTQFEEWMSYETDHFTTYWYGDGRPAAQQAVLIAEQEYQQLQQVFEIILDQKITLLLYRDPDDLKQSNIGVEEQFVQNSSLVKVVENKVFLSYDGNITHLRRDIRQGIASVMLHTLMYGGSIQEIVQNALFLKLPIWYREGIIGYCGGEITSGEWNQIRSILSNQKKPSFKKLSTRYPYLIGKAFWTYFEKQYSATSLPQFLYITRTERDVRKACESLCNLSYEELTQQCIQWLVSATPPTTHLQESMLSSRFPIAQIAKQSQGDYLAYSIQDANRWKLYLHSVREGKNQKIKKGGVKNHAIAADDQYPVFGFSPTAPYLYLIYYRRDQLFFCIYDIQKHTWNETKMTPEIKRVYHMHVTSDEELLLSANVRGKANLFRYTIKSNGLQAITTDNADDLAAIPIITSGQTGLINISNRKQLQQYNQPNDTALEKSLQQVLFIPSTESKWEAFVLGAGITEGKEIQLLGQEKDTTYFLLEKSGNVHFVKCIPDSISDGKLHSYYSKHVLKQQWQADSSYAQPVISNGIDSVFVQDLFHRDAIIWMSPPLTDAVIHTATISNRILYQGVENGNKRKPYAIREISIDGIPYTKVNTELKPQPPIPEAKPQKTNPSFAEIPAGWQIRAPFAEEESLPKKDHPENVPIEIGGGAIPNGENAFIFRSYKIVPYRLLFSVKDLSTDLDNSRLFGGLDNFVTSTLLYGNRVAGGISTVPMGLHLKARIEDLFEDYQLIGGIRVPTDFKGYEAYITFKNRKKQLDKWYSIYRSVYHENVDGKLIAGQKFIPSVLQLPAQLNSYELKLSTITNLGEVQWRYPWDPYRSARLKFTVRDDILSWKATEKATTDSPPYHQQQIGCRLEYVYDNTLARSNNILNGTRYNIYHEFVKGMQIAIKPDFQFNFQKGFTGLFGADIRHYIPLGRESVFALRGAAAISYGPQKLLFYVGGVDQWLLTNGFNSPSFNTLIPVSDEQQYLHQSFVPDLRGFQYNIRNGSKYMIGQAELRVPVFKHLWPGVKSNFFKNFQVVGFVDAGTAWTGTTPYSEDNAINSITLQNGNNVIVKVHYYRDPWIAGMGAGVRVYLLGYQLRLDKAWGIENRSIQKPIWHFSIGLDF